MARSISGDYPEVWVIYKITYYPGLRYYLVEGQHDIDKAIREFMKNPPSLEPHQSARIVEVHYWQSPKTWERVYLQDIRPLRRKGFVWRG